MKREKVIDRDPETMGETPVFAGTRVPVQTLIDYLSGGEDLDDFLDGFPSVSREQAEVFLQITQDEAFVKAIREGQQTGKVTRVEVLVELLGPARGMWKDRDDLPDRGKLRQEFDERIASESETSNTSLLDGESYR